MPRGVWLPFVRAAPRPAVAAAPGAGGTAGVLECVQRTTLPPWTPGRADKAQDAHWYDAIFGGGKRQQPPRVEVAQDEAQRHLLRAYARPCRSPAGAVFRTAKQVLPAVGDERSVLVVPCRGKRGRDAPSVFGAHSPAGLPLETVRAMQRTALDRLVFWKASPFVRGSCQKMALLVRQISGLQLDAAIVQMRMSDKKLAQVVLPVLFRIRQAVRTTAGRLGLPPDSDREFCVGAAVCGRGTYLRRAVIRARGKTDVERRGHVFVRVAAYRPDPLAIAQALLTPRRLAHREFLSPPRRVDY